MPLGGDALMKKGVISLETNICQSQQVGNENLKRSKGNNSHCLFDQ